MILVRVYGFDGWQQRPYIDEGGLDGRFYLDEVDFHWYRKGEQTGSEHSIDGTHYPIEVYDVLKLKSFSCTFLEFESLVNLNLKSDVSLNRY